MYNLQTLFSFWSAPLRTKPGKALWQTTALWPLGASPILKFRIGICLSSALGPESVHGPLPRGRLLRCSPWVPHTSEPSSQDSIQWPGAVLRLSCLGALTLDENFPACEATLEACAKRLDRASHRCTGSRSRAPLHRGPCQANCSR